MNAPYTQIKQRLDSLGITTRSTTAELTPYSTDESIFQIQPQLAVLPTNTDQLQTIASIVNEYKTDRDDNLSLTARAAGTGLSGGSLNDSIIVDVRHLADVGPVNTNDQGETTIRVGAGAYFKDIMAVTKAAGYLMPIFPSSWQICTIGGMVANNAAGEHTLKYGHVADFVDSLEVLLADGNLYEISSLTFADFESRMNKGDYLGDIYKQLWQLIADHYQTITDARPHSSKNSAGYALWDLVHAPSIEAFKAGEGHIDLPRLFSGSQGTLGIITTITLRLIPIPTESDLVVIPVYDLERMGTLIATTLEHKPQVIEVFDERTYRLALRHKGLFFKRLGLWGFVKFLFWSNYTYLRRFKRLIPKYVLLVRFDGETPQLASQCAIELTNDINEAHHCTNWTITSRGEKDMFWAIRYASLSLAKLGYGDMRPAAALEDMVIPIDQLPPFLKKLDQLINDRDLHCAIHGHGGNGHLHFYPMMDFNDPKTAETIQDLMDEFFALARQHGGNICGEHNDGIIRTRHLHLMFEQHVLDLFTQLESIWDPQDVFNPGKKTRSKFEIDKAIRTSN